MQATDNTNPRTTYNARSRSTDQSANLDFLRAYAVLSVYFGHLLQVFHVERIVGRLTIFDLAQTGVLIFFVHTSLVLMLSLDRLRKIGWRMFADFYIRRLFRIYPLSIVTIIVMVIAHVPDFPTNSYLWPGWNNILHDLTLTQNLVGAESYPAVVWSLPYEVQMYVVIPFLFVFLRRFDSWWIPIFLWIFDVSAIILTLKLGFNGVFGLLEYTPCFLGGVVGYRLWSMTRKDFSFWKWPIAITACVVFRVMAEATGIRAVTTLSSWFVCVFLGFAVPQFRELGSGWLRYSATTIAKYSYGMYLSHPVAFWVAFVLLRETPLWIQAGACLALSVLLPLAMYHGIEKPMIRFGVRIAEACTKGAKLSGQCA